MGRIVQFERMFLCAAGKYDPCSKLYQRERLRDFIEHSNLGKCARCCQPCAGRRLTILRSRSTRSHMRYRICPSRGNQENCGCTEPAEKAVLDREWCKRTDGKTKRGFLETMDRHEIRLKAQSCGTGRDIILRDRHFVDWKLSNVNLFPLQSMNERIPPQKTSISRH